MADSFFAVLDDLLGPDRSADGAPSVTDFLVLELPPIVERFATDFDGLPEVIEGFAGARLLIAAGILVRAMVVYGLLVDDNTVELVDLDLDTSTGVRVGVRVGDGVGVDGEEPSAARFAIGHEVLQEHSVVAAVEAIPQPTMLDQASDECLGDAEHHGLLGGRCHLVRALAVHGDESRHRQAHGRTESQPGAGPVGAIWKVAQLVWLNAQPNDDDVAAQAGRVRRHQAHSDCCCRPRPSSAAPGGVSV